MSDLSLSPIQAKRKRASTKALLGAEYQDIVTDFISVPKSEKDADDYDAGRLRQGLKYADITLRNTQRKLPPLGMSALSLYKNAVKNLLDFQNEVDTKQDGYMVKRAKEIWLPLIRMHEESVPNRACLNLTNSPDTQRLQDEIHNLQRIAFCLRYGNILALVCQELEIVKANVAKVSGWVDQTGKYWTEIDEILGKLGKMCLPESRSTNNAQHI